MFPDEPQRDVEACRVARHFGCEVMQGIPEGDGYWALEPRCVVGPWYRRPGAERWECLRCYGISAFSTQIEEEFLARLRASTPLVGNETEER